MSFIPPQKADIGATNLGGLRTGHSQPFSLLMSGYVSTFQSPQTMTQDG